MDHPSFALNEQQRVLRLAGIRHVLPAGPALDGVSEPAMQASESASPDVPSAPRFDAPWQAVLSKLPPRPRVLITYAELGEDLTGAADPERGRLWRTLFASLAFEKGTFGFLPYAFSFQGELSVHLDEFAGHLRTLEPLVVLVFERSAASPLSALATDASTPVRYEFLPSPGELLGMEQERFSRFTQQLRTALHSIL